MSCGPWGAFGLQDDAVAFYHAQRPYLDGVWGGALNDDIQPLQGVIDAISLGGESRGQAVIGGGVEPGLVAVNVVKIGVCARDTVPLDIHDDGAHCVERSSNNVNE